MNRHKIPVNTPFWWSTSTNMHNVDNDADYYVKLPWNILQLSNHIKPIHKTSYTSICNYLYSEVTSMLFNYCWPYCKHCRHTLAWPIWPQLQNFYFAVSVKYFHSEIIQNFTVTNSTAMFTKYCILLSNIFTACIQTKSNSDCLPGPCMHTVHLITGCDVSYLSSNTGIDIFAERLCLCIGKLGTQCAGS